MNEEQFWSIIDAGGKKARRDEDVHAAAIRKWLAKLAPAEVRDFQRLLYEKLSKSYTWELWGAAYLINGGCSDDGFDYFRAWLISQGKAVYEAAIKNPDTLAGLTDPERDDYEFEELWGVAFDVYKELTGKDMLDVGPKFLANPKGRSWDFDDDNKTARKFPALAKIYIDSD